MRRDCLCPLELTVLLSSPAVPSEAQRNEMTWLHGRMRAHTHKPGVCDEPLGCHNWELSPGPQQTQGAELSAPKKSQERTVKSRCKRDRNSRLVRRAELLSQVAPPPPVEKYKLPDPVFLAQRGGGFSPRAPLSCMGSELSHNPRSWSSPESSPENGK